MDPKTVERWITKDRVPHRTHRMNAAPILGKSDVFLWPATENDPRTRSATHAAFVDLYPSRGALPVSNLVDLIDNAREAIGLLAFAGSFCMTASPSSPSA